MAAIRNYIGECLRFQIILKHQKFVSIFCSRICAQLNEKDEARTYYNKVSFHDTSM